MKPRYSILQTLVIGLIGLLPIGQSAVANTCKLELVKRAGTDMGILLALQYLSPNWGEFQDEARRASLAIQGGLSLEERPRLISGSDLTPNSLGICLRTGIRECRRSAIQWELDHSYYGPFCRKNFLDRISGVDSTRGIVLLAFAKSVDAEGIADRLRTDPEMQKAPRIALANEQSPVSGLWLDALTQIYYTDRVSPAGLTLLPAGPRLTIDLLGEVSSDTRDLKAFLDEMQRQSGAEIELRLHEKFLWTRDARGFARRFILSEDFAAAVRWMRGLCPNVVIQQSGSHFHMTQKRPGANTLTWIVAP